MTEDNKSEIFRVTSFQDQNRFLAAVSLIPTPGNFGLSYPSSIHAYTSWMIDDMDEIMSLYQLIPGDVERIKRHEINSLNEENWEKGVQIMHTVQMGKFMSNPRFAEMLTDLSDGVKLVNQNKFHDNFWGDCLCGNRDSCRVEGQNVLGEILEDVREEMIGYRSRIDIEKYFPRIHKIVEDRKRRYGAR